MPATPITNPATGESLVGTEPQLLQQVDPGWRRRLNLFTGRALSSTALDSEQIYRGGLLGTLGQSVSAGTVNGLALSLQASGADPTLVVTPGYGICAGGVDVVLNRAMRTRMSTLTVLTPLPVPQTEQVVNLEQAGPPETQITMSQHMRDPKNNTFAGILLLQPVVAQVSGRLLDTGSAPMVVSGNLGASCAQDPAEYAFEDWQIADAVQLVYLPWPAGVPALPLPTQSPVATWRNRLAYGIFEAESLLGPDDQLPWSMLGVPVGLIAFDAGTAWAANTAFAAGQFVMDSNGYRQQAATAGSTGATQPAWNTTYGGSTTDGGVTWQNSGLGWNPLFVDCSAVVRAGGLPRRRSVLPSQPPPLEVWQSNTNFAAGQFIIDGNDNVQQVKTAGSSGGPPPAWNAAFGQTTADGSVVWVNNGPASWRANTAFTAGQFIYDSQGYLQYVATAGTSGASEPDWGGVFLQTSDGSVTWVNNGAGAQPLIQPALAQARINQLSEQLSQTLAQQTQFKTLADIFPTLPPSGILPAAALNFTNHTAPWLPPNWTVTAAPVLLEELETVIETGMMEALLNSSAAAPSNAALMEPVEVLVPLPDAVYDPNILVVPSVAPIFQQEVNAALNARNLILQRMQTVQEELNVLFTGLGPNVPTNGNLINPDAGLTPQELSGRDTFPTYLPAANETFGTVLPATWKASTSYAPGAFVIDDNGAIQVVQNAAAATSGAADPAWNTSVAGVTVDGAVNWLNNGPWSWQPNTAYAVGQFVVDAGGYRHNVAVAGTSASQPPNWNDAAGATTPDGVLWQAGGQAIWQPDIPYALGALILDSTGNVQSVQTGGISGDSPPRWNSNVGQTTQDSGVTWVNLGAATWTASTSYKTGQAILDSNKQIQSAQIGGTSGATQPVWNEGPNATTLDSAISWNNAGPVTWQANTQYGAGTIIIDSNNSLQTAKTAGNSGAKPPVWSTTPGGTTTDNAITWSLASFASTDLAQLLEAANQAPYTKQYTDSTGASQTLNLLNANDLALLASGGNGLRSLITSLSARISAANDLLDTAFLTSQTDIYRYRQNVLGATAATTLATSPVLANIATGETAAATAVNLQSYINNLLPTSPGAAPPPASTTSSTTPTSPTAPAAGTAAAGVAESLAANVGASRITRSVPLKLGAAAASTFASTFVTSQPSAFVQASSTASKTAGALLGASSVVKSGVLTKSSAFLGTTDLNVTTKAPGLLFGPATIVSPTPVAVTPTDITSQSPLTGAQLNIRTITIAQRLQQSPSQEAMFYSIANRLSFLQTLQALCADLNLVVDDLSILVDDNSQTAPANTASAGVPVAIAVKSYTLHEWINSPAQQATIISSIQSPYIVSDASEASLFSVGVRVGEQHIMLLRALEARVQQYADFVGLCKTAFGDMLSDIRQGQTYLTQQANNLMQQRQNVAFTTALLADEQTRVANLAAQRRRVLANSVQLVAYTRARTLEATDTAPSRQLVPANIGNPVPACLQQSVSIPPELREIVGQLREAPVSWLPAAALQVNKLQRPSLLQQLATSAQARAGLQLQAAPPPSSAAGESGAYATAISKVYDANQQVFRGLQAQRAAIQPAALASMSWSMQVANVQSVIALNDLISSVVVHTEVSNAVARLIQQISSVATCLYTRVSIALPVDRLAWAEYLQGAGISAGLRSLAILPNWNQQTYIDRQQMQLLVDWLFQQIDTTISAASAFMSDVVRTAILLASDVPIDHVIPGNIIVRTRPALGGIVSLNLPSDRVSSGMYVHLYSGATLAARAVVTDLDSSTVSATVTDVFKSDVYLETTDTAHFTAQTPQAVALRPLFS